MESLGKSVCESGIGVLDWIKLVPLSECNPKCTSRGISELQLTCSMLACYLHFGVEGEGRFRLVSPVTGYKLAILKWMIF